MSKSFQVDLQDQNRQTIARESLMDRFAFTWMKDQPECCVWGIITLDGPLSDDLIKKSAALLMKQVPILGARLKPGFPGGRWVAGICNHSDCVVSRKDVSDRREAERLIKGIIQNKIDVEEPPLFRVTSIYSENDYFLVLQVHHLLMDGEGAKQLFNLFAGIYRFLEEDPDWTPSTVYGMERNWLQIIKHLTWKYLFRAPFINMKEYALFIKILLKVNQTASVIKGDFSGKFESIYPEDPAFESFQLARDDMNQIKRRNKSEGVTVNDLVMAALMTTVRRWNLERGETFSYVNSIYTANLRRWWGEPRNTFVNLSVIRFLFVRSEDLADVDTALKSLKPLMNKAKNEFGLKELCDLAVLRIAPGMISRLLRGMFTKIIKQSHALTNIGVIPDSAGDFGTVQAKSYSMLAPPLPAPNLLFTVTSYKNELTVHCNFSLKHFKPETAKEFMRQFKCNILKASGGSPRALPGAKLLALIL